MFGGARLASFRWKIWRKLWPWFLLASCLFIVRLSKGAGFSDAYALLTKPFWPGSAQREWIQDGAQLDQQIRLNLLEQDNERLRTILSLQQSSKFGLFSAPVISRRPKGWWQQVELGKGSIDGIRPTFAVMGPGGLLGIVESVTPTTARVRLLTAPGSQVGVWVSRTKSHGILLGMGTNRPQLTFLDKAPMVIEGDVVSTSPASTILPPNLPVGVIQVLDKKALPAPQASVQLLAAPEAIDWVQVQRP
ncbi:rod shape-determining protein MreC [Prochlorococcus sp. MIT 1307]|uniref:rod shape-determining protein MreC n=1 Tax=Prochlorococcus sp. MIT 1307 TaxID=3096219 RepID=UPI002A751E66|nr:rod shape-determining protein MreC [Prochlorococcus sp. MIT 1307]